MKINTLNFLFACLIGIGLVLINACTSDTIADLPTPDAREIWTGATTTFEKIAGTSAQDAANQDRITDEVWITRANDGGEIYNVKAESSADKGLSPIGTQWAIGVIGDLDNLSFKSFRDAVDKPKEVVGKDLVLFLTQEEIFISVKFTAWTEGKGGGFAYERSTK